MIAQEQLKQEVKTHIIHVLHEAFGGSIPIMDLARVHVDTDCFSRALLVRLDLFLAGTEKVSGCTKEVIRENGENIKFPEDWKQAFKERWFPKWLLKKYPVIYTHKIVTTIEKHYTKITKMCPHVNVPKEHTHFSWVAAEERFGLNFGGNNKTFNPNGTHHHDHH